MQYIEFITQLNQKLLPVRNAQTAIWSENYMRKQFVFLGVSSPDRFHISRPIFKSVLPCIQEGENSWLIEMVKHLWQEKERDYQYIGVDLLKTYQKHLSVHDIPALIAIGQEKAWWDTIDNLAPLMGKIILNSPENERAMGEAIMDKCLKDDNLWVRRIGIIHQLGWKEKTDEKRLFSYALQLAHEKEFFIQKAIGWSLRMYARVEPQRVKDFVLNEGQTLSKLSQREALKHVEKNLEKFR